MIAQKQILTALAASLMAIPSASAYVSGTCKAIAWLDTNGISDVGAVTSDGIYILDNDNNEIGSIIPAQSSTSVCGSTKDVDSELPYVVEMSTECGLLTFSSCSASYGGDIDVSGTTGKDLDYYGLGTNVDATCTVKFSC